MKRLLIFTILFPPLALVVFNTPDMVAGRFGLMDMNALQSAYIIAVIPSWLVAAIDWWQTRLWATTVAGAALCYVAAFSIGFPFSDAFSVLMVGLVGAVPAAVCSWLSRKAATR
ncbi:hypothetical protein [Bradyrhizobium guangdongense]|uniref:MFS transporter n=1 Tax=Bradyrhizobium guangdongense TaxID=1325090 RepID=A0A410V8A1_9BRAD|nr:hypothetical protein [Bradyrhizobium guangdongense]QAU39857.1 hypothetical protein X265_20950 [Bradyrhizobium guangdongense]QOZ60923.1 hypothetical protein XH86_20975 [Bradyrhizobium guangdongense]GGI25391.1 hypothetical protein GCM10010987_34150 [Bradyrhizobium guangdongense]